MAQVYLILFICMCSVIGGSLATCSNRGNSTPSPSSTESSSSTSHTSPLEECQQLTQREMHTKYIKCFADKQFDMSLNVIVDDYGIFTGRANQVLDSDDFVSSFDALIDDNCLWDSLQPKNKYWQYVCDYSMLRIPQVRWAVECHHDYNPCRNKTVTCTCDNSADQDVKETGLCSDGIIRRLDCTGVCLEEEASCEVSYTIPQEWTSVNITTLSLELTSNGAEFLEKCKLTPMEVYLGNSWRLRREQVTVACTCEEQQPKQNLSG